MTDLQLLKDITDELEILFSSDGIKMPIDGEFHAINVYAQDIPQKKHEDDEDVRNYVVAMIGDQKTDGDEWDVEVHFSVEVEDSDADHSGFINVLYLMDEIYNYFIKKGIIGQKHQCRMEADAAKALNYESPYPYYEGDLITHWRLPQAQTEGLVGLV